MIYLHTSIEQYKTLINDKIKHSFLSEHIKQPKISNEKLSILTTILNQTTLPTYKKESYLITTMLVQIALDTHDLVPDSSKDEKLVSLTTKQLTVLAGDYYSGLYYLLLADIEDIDMIQMLASTIKKINELKMSFYEQNVKTLNEYIDLYTKIESILVIQVADFIQSSLHKELIEELLITSKLLEEKRNYDNNGQTPLLNFWLMQTGFSDTSLVSDIENVINEHKTRLEKHLKECTVEHGIADLIKKVIYNTTSSVVREG